MKKINDNKKVTKTNKKSEVKVPISLKINMKKEEILKNSYKKVHKQNNEKKKEVAKQILNSKVISLKNKVGNAIHSK